MSREAGTAEPLTAADLHTRLAPFLPIDRLLLAVSGGPDSIALMGLAAAAGGIPLAVASVDHGLRPENRAEAEAVARFAAELDVPHAILEWRTPRKKSRVQEAAREARYELLVAHARAIGASHLATAHTLDDQAETIFYRLARGSGPAGLVGMRPVSRRGGINHLRPLLDVRKVQLVATCRGNGWPFADDPSNTDPRYARSRWRRLLPLLEAEGLAPHRLAVLSQRLARAETALETASEAARARLTRAQGEAGLELDARALAAEPEEIVVRVLAQVLADVGACSPAPLRLQRVERLGRDLLETIADGGTLKRTLGGAIVWARSDGRLRIVPEAPRRASGTRPREDEPGRVDHAGNCSG